MGLEPTAFCMARVGERSHGFAETSRLRRLRVRRANGSEPERTPRAAIAAIVILGTFGATSRALRRSAAGWPSEMLLPNRTKNSPSQLRFRPPNPLTVRFSRRALRRAGLKKAERQPLSRWARI
jgi:hypothetical protein